MRIGRIGRLALPLLLLLPACGDEEPVGMGSELLPPQALRSFEVVLEPSQFLLKDTAFALYGGAVSALQFTVLARDYQGVLNSNAFLRFQIPTAILVTDSTGVARTDSTPTWVRGEIVLLPDTFSISTSGVTHVALHRFAESWDTAATWDFRSAGVRWSVPGGTVGALIDSEEIRTDSMILTVDSATLRQWADTTNQLRGARLSLLEGPSRLRTRRPALKLYASSRFKRDTLFTATAQSSGALIVYTPVPPTAASDIRFNGVPEWHSFLQFRPDLRTVVVSCGTGCTVPLSQTSITRAELVLQPTAAPAGFSPETELAPVAYNALLAPEFPLERSPLGSGIGTVATPLPPSRFVAGAAPVYLTLTEFVRAAVADTAGTGSTAKTSDWLAILPVGTRTFGFGTFAAQPRLRLVLSVAKEIQLP